MPVQETILAGVLVALVIRAIVRTSREHEATRRHLRAVQSELEQRVAARTEELAVANASLERRIREVRATKTLLERSEEYYRSLIENGSDIVVVLRPDGRIRYATPSVGRALGYDPDRVRGQTFVEFVPDEDIPHLLEHFHAVLEEPGRTTSLTIRVHHRDAGVRHLEAVVQNLSDQPAVAGIVFTARDVTDRIAVEEALQEQESQLRQAQKMEAVGRLAGGLAHDFNNILTVIGGHAEYLGNHLEESDPLAREAAGIHDAVGRAARLTRQLLVFSRREVTQPRILALDRVIRELDPLARRLLPESVELRTELRARRWTVRVDPGHLEQVILNLIVNSRDAMGEGGTVSIRTSDETIDETVVSRFGDITPGRYVQMTVSDTGCGIPPELVDRIFDPFFTTKGSAGTGLGLSTVFGIAREAGAGIAVESQVGRGTAVSLYFPGHEEEPVAPLPEEVAVAVPGAGETVLLVEDEDRLRALTARSLRERGYLVLSAASGEHAIRMAELYREPIDLLVTDVVMPGLSGPALHRELEERRGRLPVLFASGYPGEELSRLGVGTERLLAKPFTGAALASAVREVLDEG